MSRNPYRKPTPRPIDATTLKVSRAYRAYFDREMPEAINVTTLQISRAYQAHFDREIPETMPFTEAVRQIIAEIGHEPAWNLIASQSNDLAD